ncbi:craniofacial development protein 2-like, partial [Ostrinia furnacalis]|uniref:craniofacial development protein 2-like n=1 Tax=Ostrinia furnacalis TaxID=93504 RepID=UPI00104002D6
MRREGEGIEERNKEYILYYKGETAGLYGTGFLVKRRLLAEIEEFIGISERISMLNVRLPTGNKKEQWSIIQVYAPTEPVKNEDMHKIESFYSNLQSTITQAHSNLIVMGDFNGKVGTSKTGEEKIIGRFGHGHRSKNGQSLVNLATENKLSVMNSFFKKRNSRKWTWISPCGRYTNEIDYIMTNKKDRIKDVTVINNLNFNTDHRMVRAILEGNPVKKTRKTYSKRPESYITNKNLETFTINFKNALENEMDKSNSKNIEEIYNKFTTTLKNEIDRTKSMPKEKRISTHTQDLLQQRKELLKDKKSNTKQITEISKKINENIKKDNKVRRNDVIKYHIEKTGGIKKAYKKLSDKTEWMPNLKNKQGICTGNRKAILDIATEFYKTLYTGMDGNNEYQPKNLN